MILYIIIPVCYALTLKRKNVPQIMKPPAIVLVFYTLCEYNNEWEFLLRCAEDACILGIFCVFTV